MKNDYFLTFIKIYVSRVLLSVICIYVIFGFTFNENGFFYDSAAKTRFSYDVESTQTNQEEVRSLPKETTEMGSWIVLDNTGSSGDSHAWISSDDGWSFIPQLPWGIEFFHWDGVSWTLFQTLPKGELSYKYGIDIEMVSADDGWAIALGHYTPDTTSTLFHWDGQQWAEDQQFNAPLISINMLSADDGWMVGDETTGLGITKYYYFDGDSWSLYQQLGSGQGVASDISMVTNTDGWSVGYSIARKTGDIWQRVTSPTTEFLNAIDMVSTNDGWIVGENGTILRWIGANDWLVYPSPTTNNLLAIEMVSRNDGWAVGEDGTILHWDGTNWTIVSSPVTFDFYEIDMVSADDGYIPYYDRNSLSDSLLRYIIEPASLEINYTSGSPGSYFTITGQDFPTNASASVDINGNKLGSINTDGSGELTFILATTEADVGYYFVTVSVNPRASIIFTLDPNKPFRPQEGSGTVFAVPKGISLAEITYLPIIQQ